jgi:hypothetical protein
MGAWQPPGFGKRAYFLLQWTVAGSGRIPL